MADMPVVQEEFVYAAVASSCLGAVIAFVYWFVTGYSPWPGLILGEVIGFGWGATLLAISSPRSRG